MIDSLSMNKVCNCTEDNDRNICQMFLTRTGLVVSKYVKRLLLLL